MGRELQGSLHLKQMLITLWRKRKEPKIFYQMEEQNNVFQDTTDLKHEARTWEVKQEIIPTKGTHPLCTPPSLYEGFKRTEISHFPCLFRQRIPQFLCLKSKAVSAIPLAVESWKV